MAKNAVKSMVLKMLTMEFHRHVSGNLGFNCFFIIIIIRMFCIYSSSCRFLPVSSRNMVSNVGSDE